MCCRDIQCKSVQFKGNTKPDAISMQPSRCSPQRQGMLPGKGPGLHPERGCALVHACTLGASYRILPAAKPL